MRPFSILVIVCVLLLCSSVFAVAQRNTEEREKLRLAQTYERAGDMRNAARLYQELYALSPSSEPLFLGVVRTLSGLQQYEALLPVVEQRVSATNAASTAVLAGTLSARIGKLNEANAWWKRGQELSNNDESIIVSIGQDQLQLTLSKEALESFLLARKINGDAQSYGDEISQLYASAGDYDGSVRETLALFLSTGDVSATQRRLSALLAYEKGPDAIAKQLENLSTSTTDALRLKQWFYRQTKDWQRAFDVSKMLDENSGSKGQELLMFADGARMEDQFDIAISAYSSVMKNSPDQRFQISAAYGSIRSLDQKLRRNKSMNATEARVLVSRYDEIISSYSKHPIAADALYHSAILEDDVIKDVEAARNRLMRLQNQWKGNVTEAKGSLRLADIYLGMGADAEAKVTLERIVNGASKFAKESQDLAQLRLADLFLWAGEYDSARVRYQPLASDLASIAANDALDRLLLLNLAQDDSLTVSKLAAAEGLHVRRRYKESADSFYDAVRSAKDAELRDRARMFAAHAKVELGDDLGAESLLLDLLQGVPETIYGDRAFQLLADIQVRRGDKPSAIRTLNALLVNYPRSIFAPDVRELIRRLRGDA